jgi:hypothetical protein
MAYYGVEQSTDLRNRRTVIKRFTSIKSLNKWLGGGGGFTYEDPEAAQNYHRTLRYGYEYCGRINKNDKIFSEKGSNMYPRNYNDNLATYLYMYAKEANRD